MYVYIYIFIYIYFYIFTRIYMYIYIFNTCVYIHAYVPNLERAALRPDGPIHEKDDRGISSCRCTYTDTYV